MSPARNIHRYTVNRGRNPPISWLQAAGSKLFERYGNKQQGLLVDENTEIALSINLTVLEVYTCQTTFTLSKSWTPISPRWLLPSAHLSRPLLTVPTPLHSRTTKETISNNVFLLLLRQRRFQLWNAAKEGRGQAEDRSGIGHCECADFDQRESRNNSGSIMWHPTELSGLLG